ncbi:MAG: HU family DNA-binding protein [Parabacteroides sp.]|nr:HU family DNA-binding protein [Parabacteroides sp.]
MNNRLTIQDLAGLLADYTGKDKQSSERFLREFIAIISEGVFTDKLVKIKGIGTFKIIPVEKRESIHVNTGERFLIPAHYKFSFLPDKELREQVNKPFSFFETTELQEDVDFTDLDVVSGETEEKEIETESVEEVMPEEKALPMVEEVVSEPLPEPEPEELPLEEPEPETEVVPDMESEPQPVIDQPIVNEEPIEEPKEPLFVEPKQEEPVKPKRSYKKWIITLGVISFLLLCINALLFWKCDFFTNKQNVGQAEPETLLPMEKNEVDTVKQEVAVDTLVVEPAKDSIPVDTIPKQVEKPVEKRPEVIAEVEIKRGSRLTMIALKYYGHKLFWVYIYEYNKAIITDPNNIPIGTVIKVPAPEIYNINRKNRATLEKAATRQTEILNELAK